MVVGWVIHKVKSQYCEVRNAVHICVKNIVSINVNQDSVSKKRKYNNECNQNIIFQFPVMSYPDHFVPRLLRTYITTSYQECHFVSYFRKSHCTQLTGYKLIPRMFYPGCTYKVVTRRIRSDFLYLDVGYAVSFQLLNTTQWL